MTAFGRNHRRTMRVFYLEFGHGPWRCSMCNDLITKIGRGTMDGNVHHKDHDWSNDDPLNLTVSHTLCHQREHHSGVPKTLEHRSKVGRPGRVFTPEWRENLRRDHIRRVKCPHCDYVNSPQTVGKHKKREHGDELTCV